MQAQVNRNAFRVVITGGPCAGKTELWRFMSEAFPQGVPVPEAATDLILAGRSEESLGLENFQRAVYARQLELEEEALKKGRLLICDRGLLDGAAYLPELLSLAGIRPEEAGGRYGMVIQLEVIRDPQAYAAHCSTNPARHEGHARALVLEGRLREIYERHPFYVFLSGSLEEKEAEALRLLRKRLADTRPDLAGTDQA
jgi:predicted ATPase